MSEERTPFSRRLLGAMLDWRSTARRAEPPPPAPPRRRRLPAPRSLNAALAALLAASPAFAAGGDNAGVTAAPVLQLPLGARATGMGTAFTAVADDVSTLHYNPAGLANIGHREATFMYLDGQEQQDVQYGAIASPVPYFTGLSGSGYATIGASILFAQNGTIDFNSTNPDGSLASSTQLDAGGDMVATLGYSERVAESVFDYKDGTRRIHHFFGASGKFIRSTLTGDYTASTFASDFGYIAKCPELGLSIAGSVLNLGGKMKFIEVGDHLPLAMRLGAAYQVPMPISHALTWANDAEYHYYDRVWFVNTGLEYTLFKAWAARIGYQIHRELAGLTVGFGARWKNWGFDYAWGLNDDLGDTHRMSFSFRFGTVPVREREKARRPFIESVPDREELKELEQERPETYDAPKRPRRQAPEGRGAPGWIY